MNWISTWSWDILQIFLKLFGGNIWEYLECIPTHSILTALKEERRHVIKMNGECLNLKKNYSERLIAFRPYQSASPYFEYTYPIILATLWSSSKSLILQCVIKNKGECCCCMQPTKRQTYKDPSVRPHLPYSAHLVLWNSWLFLKVTWPKEDELESIHGIKSVRKAQSKTLSKKSPYCFRKG